MGIALQKKQKMNLKRVIQLPPHIWQSVVVRHICRIVRSKILVKATDYVKFEDDY